MFMRFQPSELSGDREKLCPGGGGFHVFFPGVPAVLFRDYSQRFPAKWSLEFSQQGGEEITKSRDRSRGLTKPDIKYICCEFSGLRAADFRVITDTAKGGLGFRSRIPEGFLQQVFGLDARENV